MKQTFEAAIARSKAVRIRLCNVAEIYKIYRTGLSLVWSLCSQNRKQALGTTNVVPSMKDTGLPLPCLHF